MEDVQHNVAIIIRQFLHISRNIDIVIQAGQTTKIHAPGGLNIYR